MSQPSVIRNVPARLLQTRMQIADAVRRIADAIGKRRRTRAPRNANIQARRERRLVREIYRRLIVYVTGASGLRGRCLDRSIDYS
eukprot:1382552-Prymnesium_polylepis.1